MVNYYTHDDDEDEISHKSQDSKHSCFIAVVFLLLGISLGILSFDRLSRSELERTLGDTEIRHNETLKILLDRLDVAIQETKECRDDDAETLELAKLRGRLMGQVNMTKQYQKLQQEIEGRHQQIENLKRDVQLREQENEQLREEIEKKRIEIDETTKAYKQLNERAARLSEQRDGLTRQLKALDMKAEELNSKVGDYKHQIDQFTNRILQRESFHCKEEYGMGPYYVQFGAQTRGKPDSPTWSFVVELASRRDMPHSVFTFLSLVSYEMYNSTTFVANDRKIMSLSLNMEAEAAFQQKRRALGMQDSILMVPEVSSHFPCEELSVGFQGLGPSLEFYFVSESTHDQSCFGRVVRGGESLKLIRDLVFKGTNVDILQVQHLELERS